MNMYLSDLAFNNQQLCDAYQSEDKQETDDALNFLVTCFEGLGYNVTADEIMNDFESRL